MSFNRDTWSDFSLNVLNIKNLVYVFIMPRLFEWLCYKCLNDLFLFDRGHSAVKFEGFDLWNWRNVTNSISNSASPLQKVYQTCVTVYIIKHCVCKGHWILSQLTNQNWCFCALIIHIFIDKLHWSPTIIIQNFWGLKVTLNFNYLLLREKVI